MRIQLRGGAYPGRGLALGMDATGTAYVVVYWLTGRSASSRNRILVADDDGAVHSVRFQDDVEFDSRYRVYTAIRTNEQATIVANGSHSDVMVDAIRKGRCVEEALSSETYELDPPIFTSRIAVALHTRAKPLATFYSICRNPAEPSQALHSVHRCNAFRPGCGLCLQTYASDGALVEAFTELPYPIVLPGSIVEIARRFWDAIDEAFRVSVAVQFRQIDSGQVTTTIINANLDHIGRHDESGVTSR